MPGSGAPMKTVRIFCAILLTVMLLGSAWLALEYPNSVAYSEDPGARPTLDQFGGVLVKVNETNKYFTVKKLSNRWVFVTPEGHPFWMLAVFNVQPARSYNVKYPDSRTWGEHTATRLRTWGFNALAMSPSIYVLPENVKDKLPYTFNLWPSYYGLTNNGNYAPAPFKDLVDCLDATYTGYRGGSTPDVFDPNFTAYVDGRLKSGQTDSIWGPILRSPWNLGITTDDADQLFGFGPGPEIPGEDGVTQPHIGWFAIAASPAKSSSSKWGVKYTDSMVHTKYALRDFLVSRYRGSIDALNSAWRSNYTSFDSAGGYGAGSGLLDENGRHDWLGTRDGSLKRANSAVVADLDAFLYAYAKHYFFTVTSRIKQYYPNHLVFGPATLNGHGGLTRRQVLNAAGQYVDVLNAGITPRLLEKTVQYAGDIPIITWEGYVSNPDSALYQSPNPSQPWAYGTQPERARAYKHKLDYLFNATTKSGAKPVVGIQYWEWADNWSEKLNWGLVTFRENAYDGKEAAKALGQDPRGFATGGEGKDFGDFISDVRNTNADILGRFVKDLTPIRK